MNKLLFNTLLLTIVTILSGCSSYSEEDVAQVNTGKKESACVNMEPAQEQLCKDRERKLVLKVNQANCQHPYQYEKNRCENEQENKKQLLNDSLSKHTKN